MKWSTRCKRWKSKRTRRLHVLDMRRLRRGRGGPDFELAVIASLNAQTNWESEMFLLYGVTPEERMSLDAKAFTFEDFAAGAVRMLHREYD